MFMSALSHSLPGIGYDHNGSRTRLYAFFEVSSHNGHETTGSTPYIPYIHSLVIFIFILASDKGYDSGPTSSSGIQWSFTYDTSTLTMESASLRVPIKSWQGKEQRKVDTPNMLCILKCEQSQTIELQKLVRLLFLYNFLHDILVH